MVALEQHLLLLGHPSLVRAAAAVVRVLPERRALAALAAVQRA
jgi:hypothetical protein